MATAAPAHLKGLRTFLIFGLVKQESDHYFKEALMMEKEPLPVNTLSAEFKDGVEAGLNSPEDTNNWIAGNDLGRALNAEPGNESRPANPLFTRSSPERPRGNDQDEKDETEE